MAVGKLPEGLKPVGSCTTNRRAFSLGEWKQAMTEDLKNAIKQNAEGPKQASADGVSTQQHSLADQIEADKYLAGKEAMAKKNFGLTRVKIVPPGSS